MAAMDFQSLMTLIDQEIPDGRKSLQDNYTNLEHVAKYCESNYLQAQDKRKALEETKNYTTHSLASVAYQVNALATNFLRLLDLQQDQLANMESSVNHLSQIVMIHKEKVARREIGVLTTNRTALRPLGVKSGILFPEQTERPIKYTRKPIDYSSLDDIGHGVRQQGQGQATTPRAGRSPSISSSGSGSQAPTTRPPTPPGYRQGNPGAGGTLGRSSGHYRSIPPPVAPPVPSPAQHSPGGNNNSNAPVKIQGPYAPAPQAQMGQIHLPQGMMGRPGSHLGREAMMMMPGMGPGGSMMMGPGGQGSMQRPKSNTHIVQPAPAPLTGQESMEMPPPPPLLESGDLILEASPPLPPPPNGASGDNFDYTHMAPLPPPEFSDHGDADDDRSQISAPPEDPYAATGPGFLGPGEWVPKTYIEKVVAIYDYEADKGDELSFAENSVIYVIRKNDDGWWEGVMDGITGLFPSNYVEPCM